MKNEVLGENPIAILLDKKMLKDKLSIHDCARLFLLVMKLPGEVDRVLARGEDKETTGKQILQLLNDPMFAHQLGFSTLFPRIEPNESAPRIKLHEIADLASRLRQFQPTFLKEAYLKLYAMNVKGWLEIPSTLFDVVFPDFRLISGRSVLITCAESSLGLALSLATRFPACEFTVQFESAETLGILHLLFGDLANVKWDERPSTGQDSRFSGFDHIIAFRVPRYVASGVKRRLRTGGKQQARRDVDPTLQKMLTEADPKSQFIVMVPELFMYAHELFKEIRDSLSSNNRISKIVRISNKAIAPNPNALLHILHFANFEITKDTGVELLKVDSAKESGTGIEPALNCEIADRRFVSPQELASSDIWNLEAMFAEQTISIASEIKTVLLSEIAKDMYRGIPTQPAEKARDVDTIRVVGLSEMTSDITEVDSIPPTNVGLVGRPDRYLLQDGDIVVTARSTVTKMSVIRMSGKTLAVPSNNVVVIRVKQEIMEPYFLYIFLLSGAGQQALQGRQSGAGQKALGVPALGTIQVPVLPISEQKKIVQHFRDANAWYEAEKKKLDQSYAEKLRSLERPMGIE